MGFDPKNCYICIKKHPFVSCILLFYFLVYMFLPSALNVLIYTAPLIVISAVVDGFFCSIDSKRVKNVKGKENLNYGVVQDDHIVDKRESSSAIQKPRQRNVKEKNEEEHAVEDKNPVSSTSFKDDFVDKTAVEEENPKEIREVKVDYAIGKGETEVAQMGSSRYEEEAKRSRDKIIEWTKDDQNNPMDVGVFEVEKTKRLESLMARRRARKQLSLQVRKTPMKVGGNEPYGQITSIYIPKANPFLSNNASTQLATPGSAPSRLVPMKNPYDIPYDPYEEKPNLIGDSFSQGFMAPKKKEMMYCRHESFDWGGFVPWECKHDQHETVFYHGFATPRLSERPHKNKFGHPSGEAMFNGGSARHHVKDINKVQTKQMLVEDSNGGSSSSFSSEANSFTFSDPKTRAEEHLLYADKEMNHTPTNSIASDMQVEVSESGSPLLTIDGNSSSSDEESSINEIVCGSEEMFSVSSNLSGLDKLDSVSVSSNLSGLDKLESRLREVSVSSNLSGMDKNESRSRDVYGISEIIEKLSSPSARSIEVSDTISRDFKSIAITPEMDL
ncbi:hypothetical protein LguiA_011999 [Lonicera macranthoides]